MDIAASIQVVTEKLIRGLALHAREITGKNKLCLAGGVALNCVANGKILREGLFDDLWIQPAAGDAGGALGAALFTHYQLQNNAREVQPNDAMRGSLLGSHWTHAEIESAIEKEGAVHRQIEGEQPLLEAVADYLQLAGQASERVADALEKIVPAAYHGRIETLFIAAGVQQWGVFNTDTNEIEFHDQNESGDESLLDLAAIQSYLKGGTVYAVEPDKVPGGTTAAAVLRY